MSTRRGFETFVPWRWSKSVGLQLEPAVSNTMQYQAVLAHPDNVAQEFDLCSCECKNAQLQVSNSALSRWIDDIESFWLLPHPRTPAC